MNIHMSVDISWQQLNKISWKLAEEKILQKILGDYFFDSPGIVS